MEIDLIINNKTLRDIKNHCEREHPKESCGLIVDGNYYPCQNIADGLDLFEISPYEYLKYSSIGDVDAIVHSHTLDGGTDPSYVDLVQMQTYDIPWVITNGSEVAVHYPKPFDLPLLGREYIHGVFDCYTLMKDYFDRELNVKLPNFDREDEWWNDPHSPELYLDNYESCGFVEVGKDELKKHDVLLCRIGRTMRVNHAAIYLGDGKLTSEEAPPVFGDSIIIHHPYGRDSLREIFGRQWYDRTSIVIRHRSLL